MDSIFDHIHKIENHVPGEKPGPGSVADYLNQATGQMMSHQNDWYNNVYNSIGTGDDSPGMASPRRIYNERYAAQLQNVYNNAPYGTVNPASGLGTTADLGAGNGGRTPPPYMFFGFLDDIYRENFLFRNAVDIPADDLTREGRRFLNTEISKATQKQLKIRQRAEEILEVQKNLNLALKWARLYGGSGIVLGMKGETNLAKPLDYKSIRKGDLVALNSVMKDQLIPLGIIDLDVNSPYYREVAMYAITTWQSGAVGQWGGLEGYVGDMQKFKSDMSNIKDPNQLDQLDKNLKFGSGDKFASTGSGAIFVHRSRLIIFNGYSVPVYASFRNLYWGDSILVPAWNVLDLAEQVWQGAAQLLLKANIDVIYSENFLQVIKKNNGELDELSRKIKRLASNYNFMFLDKSLQQLERKQLGNLGGVKDIVDMYLRLCAMAFRMPMAKIGSGLNIKGSSNTDTELVLYYDFIKGIQSSIKSELRHLDRIIECSLFGEPKDIEYEWPNLFSVSPQQQGSLDLQAAQKDLIQMNAAVVGIDDVRKKLEAKGEYDKIEAKELLPEIMGEIDKDIQISTLKEQKKLMPEGMGQMGSLPKPNSGDGKGPNSRSVVPDHGDRFKTTIQKNPSLKSQVAKPTTNDDKFNQEEET